MASTSTGPSPSTNAALGIGLAGLTGVVVGSILQYFIISHGAEGTQNALHYTSTSLSFIFPLIFITILGFILYNTAFQSPQKLLYMFLLIIFSFLLNSISIVLSLHNVKVITK